MNKQPVWQSCQFLLDVLLIQMGKILASTTSHVLFDTYLLLSYQTAFKVRQEELNTSVKAILVDYPTDTMCFIVYDGAEADLDDVKASFDFTLPMESSLKIHNSAYDFVSSMSSFDSSLKDASMYFPVVLFNSSTEATEYFSNTVKSLRQYSSAVFDGFFWTSKMTATAFKKAPPSVAGDPAFQEDLKRQKAWLSAQDTFKRVIQSGDQHDDPCGWTAAIAKTTVHEVNVQSDVFSAVDLW